MTYKQIQENYKRIYYKSIKNCWIADVKRELGLTKRIANNRIDKNSVRYPCKDKLIRERIKKIIKNELS